MRVFIKIIVTIIFLIAFVFFYGLVNTYRQNQGYHTAGPIGSAIVLGMFVGIFLIWKYNPSKDIDQNDKNKLDKS